MQQSYVVDGYLQNMDLHKCQLIQSFKDYSLELYSQINTVDDFNYITYLNKVRGMYLLPKSDVEVVIVDEDSELYHNTIIQLKLMGYTEILEIDENAEGTLKKWYAEYKEIVTLLQISRNTKVRYFICQLCMRRFILDV